MPPRRRVPGSPAPRPAGGIRPAALRLLGRRDYTAAELTDRLASRGYPRAEVAAVVQRLADEGLQDDRRAAAAHVRSARQVKARGRLRIARELEARGLAPAVVAEALSVLTPEDEAAELGRVLARRRPPGRLDPAVRRRLFQHLLRRGFPADLIAAALRQTRD
jgi:regulatory protein